MTKRTMDQDEQMKSPGISDAFESPGIRWSVLVLPEMTTVTIDKDVSVFITDEIVSPTEHHRQHGIFVFAQCQ